MGFANAPTFGVTSGRKFTQSKSGLHSDLGSGDIPMECSLTCP